MPTSNDVSLRARHHVTAILVTHDGSTWLPEVVAALSKQSYSFDQLFAVDTGSKDDSVQLLGNASIQVFPAARETGFGAAINLGLAQPAIERATDGRTEWIWVLHDDCAPAADALERLLEAVDQRPNVAMAGPKLRGWYDRKHLLEVGVSIAGNGSRWTGLEFREQDQGQRDEIREVLAVSTAGALVRRDIYEELGGFDPELTLFRDDVDFGWRAHTAGHSVIVVPSAAAFHAEASANERRSIDVSDAFLHRPLLLDRRHAAYVLMANTSLWLTPVIAIALLGAAVFRSAGFLLAKLPGYALDELAAVALVIAKPQDLIRARRARRANRLLSSRVISRFVPPRGTQIALTFDRARAALLRSWRATALTTQPTESVDSAIDFDEVKESEADIELVKSPSLLQFLRGRPLFSTSILVLITSILAFRGRFSELVGGALPIAPDSGLNLLQSYANSWHEVGLGSSVSAPPWLALIGAVSATTAFNADLFIAALFILAVPLAFFGAYRLARSFTNLHYLALSAALLYAFTPTTLSAINSGRLGTVVLIIIGPWLFRALLRLESLQLRSWQSTWGLAFLMTIVFAFSPLTFIAIFIWQVILGIFDLVTFNTKAELTKELFDARNLRRIVIVVAPLVACAPWSIGLVLNPSRLVLDPGLPFAGGDVSSLLLANPGGPGSPPIWLISPVIVIALVSLFVERTARIGEVALFFLGFAVLLGSRQIAGHGQAVAEPLWVGSLLVIPVLAALLAGVMIADEYLPRISEVNLDARHLLLGSVSMLSILSVIGSIIWWIATPASAPLQSKSASSLPAFLSASAQSDERFKTLVIRSESDRISFFVARDRDLVLGEPDLIVGLAPEVNRSIINLVTGAGIDSSKVLAQFGIGYVFLAEPYGDDLVRTIDSVGGFTRAAKTDEGVTWKVADALAYMTLVTREGRAIPISSTGTTAKGVLSLTGSVFVTEKFDGNWRMLLNGRQLELYQTEYGIPRFEVTEPGEFIIFHDGTARRAWISWQVIAFVTLLVLALPARRRRSEMRPEELS